VTEATPYSRPISYSERLYLVAESIHPAFCIQIVAEGEGPLDVCALRSAVSRAGEANPGSRLVQRGAARWARWVASGAPELRVIDPWVPELRAGSVPAELVRTLPPESGPTCEVVCSSSGNRHRLIFRCFHGVMDARGLLHFAEEVFRRVRGERLLGAPCTPELARQLGGAVLILGLGAALALGTPRKPIAVALP
jgi:hypothetical protein